MLKDDLEAICLETDFSEDSITVLCARKIKLPIVINSVSQTTPPENTHMSKCERKKKQSKTPPHKFCSGMQENRLPNDSTDQDTCSFAYLEANTIEIICIVYFLTPV